MTPDPTGHSPLGASGAYRWMPCPGSVRLSYGIEDEESEYASLGTAAHALGESCLTLGEDAWEWLGQIAGLPGTENEVDKDMADAVQVYLNAVRSVAVDRHQGNFWVEKEFHCPEIHEYMWGKADAVYWDEPNRTLHLWDYKHGIGISVDVQEDPQTMDYSAGIMQVLNLWDVVDKVVLHIVQPRGFHFDGPVRSWSVSTEDLIKWVDGILVPAMDRPEFDMSTKSGDHCRFCPARTHACPQLLKDMDELEELMLILDKKDSAAELTNAQVGRFLDLFEVAKIVGKAADETAYARLQAGKKVPGRKLVKATKHRAWKDGAEAKLKKHFGEAAMTEPKLRSPNQIEELIKGAEFTARYAFKPDGGVTVVAESNKKPAVVRDMQKLFKDAAK